MREKREVTERELNQDIKGKKSKRRDVKTVSEKW